MRLLIVDDEFFEIQGLLEDIHKEKIGITHILTANCYSQAVNIFMENKIDILLCDIEMPFGSGLDLVEWVKKNYPDTECIFLTCHDEFDFARQAIKLKCMDYILKPADADVVNSVLKSAVDHIRKNNKEDIYKEYGKLYFNNMTQAPEPDCTESGHAVEKIEKYIAMNIEEEFSVEELAEMVYLSPAHLSRLFKKKHNMTLSSYITEQRMKIAVKLLETTDMSLAAISAKSGYSNYSYFTTIFKKTYGKTPRDYRHDFSEM